MNHTNEIAQCITQTLARYFSDLDGEVPSGVYDMVIRQVEKPMLSAVLAQAQGNQTIAAQMLGINRNTLRRKLLDYSLID